MSLVPDDKYKPLLSIDTKTSQNDVLMTPGHEKLDFTEFCWS